LGDVVLLVTSIEPAVELSHAVKASVEATGC
jgi:hypothetical protein